LLSWVSRDSHQQISRLFVNDNGKHYKFGLRLEQTFFRDFSYIAMDLFKDCERTWTRDVCLMVGESGELSWKWQKNLRVPMTFFNWYCLENDS
jgi:hypothetical protein